MNCGDKATSLEPAHSPPSPVRILIVDDNRQLLRVYERMLAGQGYEIDVRSDGEEAERALLERPYDVVLTDIDMPKVGGLELLERVRAHDLDVSVVLVTGCPGLETAARAVAHGALRYLQKPLQRSELREVTALAVRQHAIARATRAAVAQAGGIDRFTGRQELAASFDRALDSLYVAFQPIVSWSRRQVHGYEALLRSREPALPNPPAVLDAAERLGRVHDLGRKVRALAVAGIASAPSHVQLFVNLHPLDLLDDELLDPGSPLARVAGRVVLEVTERASLAVVADLQDRIAKLRARGFRIAVDDLGAGYAGLTTFAQLEPEVTKLDMSLVRDVHRQKTKLTLATTLLTMCHGLGVRVVAEGIETAEERDALAQAGCDLMQGYLFAKPAAALPEPCFD